MPPAASATATLYVSVPIADPTLDGLPPQGFTLTYEAYQLS